MTCRNRAISYLYGGFCKTQGNNDNVLRFAILQVAFCYRFPPTRNDVFEGYEIDGRFCKGLFIGIRLNLWLTHKSTA